MMVMKPSYLRKGLNVPLEFGREHFTEGFHSVKLMLPDGRKTWPARFFLRSTIKALLSGGWNAFARENILLEGDCCVFEVFKKEDIEMKVTLFRVLEDRIPLPRSVTVKTRIPPVIKESKATQEAREFTSENPFYTVYMHQSYARRSGMIMKSDFVKSHMTNEVDKVILQNTDGTKWSVNCVIKDGAGKFGRGWGPFVKENNIEEGDVCAFELIDKKDNVLKVSIFKNC